MAETTLPELRKPPVREEEDFKLNLFTSKGFALAQRIAMAYQEASAVPALFRRYITKREKRGSEYFDVEVENPSAFGNMLIAIETAQAIGMSITAVMQNANIIEGKLTWSGKFVIAAINASGLFTNLRFRVVNKGLVKIKYKEKGAWNQQNRGYDFIEREIEIENLECTAWAYPIVNGKPDVSEKIEGAPVSMKMAVEEGWYAKPGSKWQGDMKHLMLQYRSGSFFGNIHAPQITMGMGKTTEEVEDIIDVKEQPDGKYAADLDALRARTPAQTAADDAARQAKADSATTVEATETLNAAAGAPKTEPTEAAKAEPVTKQDTPAASATPAASQTPPGNVGTEFDRPQEGSSQPAASSQYTDDDTLALALDFAKKGDNDSARDLKNGLSDAMKSEIEAAISYRESKKPAAAEPARTRQQRSFNV